MQQLPGTVRITPTVLVQADATADAATRDQVGRALRDGGAVQVRTGGPVPPGTLTVAVGSAHAAAALGGLPADSPQGLPAGGYVLQVAAADGAPRIVLAGTDPLGTFHAAQTLAQLVHPVGGTARSALPAVRIRDWPATPMRGVVEGFYGTPWSQHDRLAQLDFDARFKLDTYIYSPKSDPYLRDRWRDRYPGPELSRLRALVQRAAWDHVTFVYALSPGTSVCYSSASDAQALEDKFQQLWDLGVRSFAVPLDDVDYLRWNCAADARAFGSGGGAAGRAQAYLLNRVQREFNATHRGAEPLITVPSEYGELRPTAYKSALADRLDPAITVVWTGPQVVSTALTGSELAAARQMFAHPVLVWDNYPVNDYDAGRLLLGPYTGREPGLLAPAAGLVANPMPQAAASDPVLFAVAAYTWNPAGYRPDAALEAGLSALAGDNPQVLSALRAFADVNHASRIDAAQAPVLSALIAAYWHDPAAGEAALREQLTLLVQAPGILQAMPDASFRTEAAPWLGAARDWAEAALAALRLARHEGGANRQQALALRTRARSWTVPDWRGEPRTVEVGDGVLDAFVTRALAAA